MWPDLLWVLQPCPLSLSSLEDAYLLLELFSSSDGLRRRGQQGVPIAVCGVSHPGPVQPRLSYGYQHCPLSLIAAAGTAVRDCSGRRAASRNSRTAQHRRSREASSEPYAQILDWARAGKSMCPASMGSAIQFHSCARFCMAGLLSSSIV